MKRETIGSWCRAKQTLADAYSMFTVGQVPGNDFLKETVDGNFD